MPKVVLAAGCFDLFHVAHLRYLQEAATMGDMLVVSVTKDRGVKKGPDRPIDTEDERLEIIRSLRCVHLAELNDDGVDAIRKWKPAIFVKGDDWRLRGLPEEITTYCEKNNIEIRFTRPNPHTTTNRIKRLQCAS